MAILIVLVIFVIIIGFFISVYNGLVRLRNQVENGFSQIDIQLKRRHDLIPNLVEVAKRYLGHEETTLIEVTKARNLAVDTSHDIENVDEIAKAEGKLSKALMQLYAVSENYPELKADSLMKQTMDEITNTENRIAFARQHYNDSVMFYNNQREVFPNNIISGFFKFDKLLSLEFADKSAIEIAPKINMG